MPDHVIYTAVLPIPSATARFVADLLAGHRLQVGTRSGRRALDTWDQAVLFLRWLHDATRIAQLAVDNHIGRSTAYRYVHETLTVLADQAPAVHSALTAASMAGYTHINLDGTVIRTDRCSIAGPTRRVDLWWSGKHKAHGGNIQVMTAPDGWPIWVSPVRPGREHDTTCARAADGLLQAVQTWNTAGRHVLADLGYEALDDQFVIPAKKPTGGQLTINERARNALHHALRGIGERGNALLKNFKALRRVSLSPSSIGPIVAAALVILHHIHDRTT